MPEPFDAYRKWLGIPPAEQPPHHYGLLGTAPFEDDPDTIANAADRQMAHLRTFQAGPHSADSQKLLNEVAAARICLLDLAKKATYDEQLRRQLTPPQPTPLRAVAPEVVEPQAVAPRFVHPRFVAPQAPARVIPMAKPMPAMGGRSEPIVQITPTRGPTKLPRRRSSGWPLAIGAVLFGTAVVGYVIWTKPNEQSPARKETRLIKKPGPTEVDKVVDGGEREKRSVSEQELAKVLKVGKDNDIPGVKPSTGTNGTAKDGTLDSKPALIPTKPEPPAEPIADKQPPDLLDVDLPGFVPLFNGKDLTGWKPHPDARGYWHVENGILIGSGLKMSHLFTERGDFSNFHLRAKLKINDGGDSGVFFRSRFGPGRPDGYEAQINNTQAHLNKTGSLFTSPDTLLSVHESWAQPGRPFWLEVVAEGNRFVVKVDGETIADYTDDKQRFTSGHIALQQWDPQTVVEFHKIEIKELGPIDQDRPPASEPKTSLASRTAEKKRLSRDAKKSKQRELLRNPGCEEPLQNGVVPDWVTVKGEWGQNERETPPFEGIGYFRPLANPEAELLQDIDVSEFADRIDARRQRFEFKGYMRSYPQKPPDTSRIVIEYRDGSGEVLDTIDTGPIASVGLWNLYSDNRRAPKRTRLVRVRLISVRIAEKTRDNDGYYDSLSFRAITK